MLRWFGYVQRHPSDAVVKRYTMLFCHYIERGCGRPKGTWIETIRKDMDKLEHSVDMVYDNNVRKESVTLTSILWYQADDDDIRYIIINGSSRFFLFLGCMQRSFCFHFINLNVKAINIMLRASS